jgi:hypothetical protein
MTLEEACKIVICSGDPYGTANIWLHIGLEIVVFASSYLVIRTTRWLLSLRHSVR